jgi:hypothetical protein
MDEKVYEQGLELVEVTTKSYFQQVLLAIADQNVRIDSRFQKIETDLHWIQVILTTVVLAIIVTLVAAALSSKILHFS